MDGESKSTNLHDLCDASFSYLTAAQQNYVFKLTESSQVSPPEVISSEETSVPISLERPNKAEEGEISVFGAEQYFNMKLDDSGSRGTIDANAGNFVHEANDKRVDLHRMRPKGRFGAPSVSSESSWNSQTALLPSNKRNFSRNSSRQSKKVNERWFFSCHGTCSDDKSVYVDTNVAHRGHQVSRNPTSLERRKPSQSRFQAKDEFGSSSGFEKTCIGSKREDYLVLPTVNSGVQNLAVRREKKKTLEDEEPRASLEVFGSHVIKKEDIASNLERKLSVLSWDAIPYPKAQNLPNSCSSQIYEGPGSDASSDLFEIENISCSTQPIFTKQNSDGMSGCMTPVSRYEPSETSIEWSVVTASAADFSFAFDHEDKNSAATGTAALASTPRIRRANSLLGCKSHKAVDVAETAYKKNEKPKPNFHHQRNSLDSSVPIRKSPADSKVKDLHIP